MRERSGEEASSSGVEREARSLGEVSKGELPSKNAMASKGSMASKAYQLPLFWTLRALVLALAFSSFFLVGEAGSGVVDSAASSSNEAISIS